MIEGRQPFLVVVKSGQFDPFPFDWTSIMHSYGKTEYLYTVEPNPSLKAKIQKQAAWRPYPPPRVFDRTDWTELKKGEQAAWVFFVTPQRRSGPLKIVVYTGPDTHEFHYSVRK